MNILFLRLVLAVPGNTMTKRYFLYVAESANPVH